MEQRAFPLVTKERQQAYEQITLKAGVEDKTPLLCGYYGRACRCMDDPEGACRMLCWHCGLAEHCEAEERHKQAHE